MSSPQLGTRWTNAASAAAAAAVVELRDEDFNPRLDDDGLRLRANDNDLEDGRANDDVEDDDDDDDDDEATTSQSSK
jgi:hypothetical protein